MLDKNVRTEREIKTEVGKEVPSVSRADGGKITAGFLH
jgi:hypothetical protein